ncbi:hypothetical protein [Hymenobacter volaticus]|uniref:Uncharacterized protein n=1 Tax=Hymenobacter volaticus TaxID=2932254 RepID=A0ABY4G2R2_9BACT|nr:hypothetical protein [Hymenobacter volaticus]UOQ65132.1 hypothetical protein MUN86_16420 [Hymenobacter volaticus]
MVHVAATTRVPVRVLPYSKLASANVLHELVSFSGQRAAENRTAVLNSLTTSSLPSATARLYN